jgi:adenylate cyclase
VFLRHEENLPGKGWRSMVEETTTNDRRSWSLTRVVAATLAAALPLAGLASLLLRSELDPHIENYRAHFIVFEIVGGVAFVLGYAAGEAANRRGDARVLLLSLAFMATGGFLGLHALGTPGVLFTKEYGGFMDAIPVGLLVSAVFLHVRAAAGRRGRRAAGRAPDQGQTERGRRVRPGRAS